MAYKAFSLEENIYFSESQNQVPLNIFGSSGSFIDAIQLLIIIKESIPV